MVIQIKTQLAPTGEMQTADDFKQWVTAQLQNDYSIYTQVMQVLEDGEWARVSDLKIVLNEYWLPSALETLVQIGKLDAGIWPLTRDDIAASSISYYRLGTGRRQFVKAADIGEARRDDRT